MTSTKGKAIISLIHSNYSEKSSIRDNSQLSEISVENPDKLVEEDNNEVVDIDDDFSDHIESNELFIENEATHNDIQDDSVDADTESSNIVTNNIPLILMYKGRKYFWRTKSNLHIHVVEHINSNCIEFIAYDTDLNQEAPRIYLQAIQAYETIDQQEYEQQVQDIKTELLKNNSIDIPEDVLLQEAVRRNMMAQRLIENMSVLVRPFLVNILPLANNTPPMTSVPSIIKSK
jgi:hypothetical protein